MVSIATETAVRYRRCSNDPMRDLPPSLRSTVDTITHCLQLHFLLISHVKFSFFNQLSLGGKVETFEKISNLWREARRGSSSYEPRLNIRIKILRWTASLPSVTLFPDLSRPSHYSRSIAIERLIQQTPVYRSIFPRPHHTDHDECPYARLALLAYRGSRSLSKCWGERDLMCQQVIAHLIPNCDPQSPNLFDKQASCSEAFETVRQHHRDRHRERCHSFSFHPQAEG
jgi:hypothetical protein